MLLRVVYWFVPPDFTDSGSKWEYTKVRQHYGYDWFNTNPIYVLQSQYFRGGQSNLDAHGEDPLVYFKHGKECQTELKDSIRERPNLSNL